jgi:hypothetical protein
MFLYFWLSFSRSGGVEEQSDIVREEEKRDIMREDVGYAGITKPPL